MVWYNRFMKKLLVLLLLSPLAFAEPINISCEYYQAVNMETFELITQLDEGTDTFTIKSSTKEIIMQDSAFPYTEKGNQITWSSYSAIDVGDIFGEASVYRLNRLSGELEHDYRDITKLEGFELQDIISLVDAENYPLGYTLSAKCKKVEALF